MPDDPLVPPDALPAYSGVQRQMMLGYRDALNAQIEQATADLAARWEVARGNLQLATDRIVAEMEQALANGDTITYAWLAQAARLNDLKGAVEGNVDAFAQWSRELVGQNQLSAIDAGQEAAQEALNATIPPGVSYTFGVPPRDVSAQLAGGLQDGSPLANLFAQLGPQAAQMAQGALFTSVALGEGPAAAARRLAFNTDMSAQRAEVIARTEIARAWRGSQMENYRANSDVVQQWMWSCDFSDRVCGACLAMDSTLHSLDEDLDDHIMGRCSALPVTRPWSDILRDAGMSQDRIDALNLIETNVTSQGFQTGAQWFDGLSAAAQDSILGPAKGYLYREGDLALSDLVDYNVSHEWGTSIKEASLKDLGYYAPDVLAEARAAAAETTQAAMAEALTKDAVAADMVSAEERYAQMVSSAETVSQALRDVVPGEAQLKDLAARVEDDPAFAKLTKRLGYTPGEPADVYIANIAKSYQGTSAEAVIANIQSIWNGTIGMNGDAMAVALRMAVRDEFGLTEKVTAADADIMKEARSLYRGGGEGLRAVVRAAHDQTQEWFVDQGITELTVYRGRSWYDAPDASMFNGTVSVIDVPIRAISSWSTDPAVALDFATSGGDYAMVATDHISVSQVWATAYAGFGTPGEAEVLLMGDMQRMSALSWNNADVSEDVTTADVLQHLAGVESPTITPGEAS